MTTVLISSLYSRHGGDTNLKKIKKRRMMKNKKKRWMIKRRILEELWERK